MILNYAVHQPTLVIEIDIDPSTTYSKTNKVLIHMKTLVSRFRFPKS